MITPALAPAVTAAATRWPTDASRSSEAPIGARVSMSPKSSSTTMAPT
jgi:hypothetical protein